MNDTETTRGVRTAALAKLREMKNEREASCDSLERDAEHLWKTFRQSVNYFKSQL